jgi:putative hydrolase of the HAD superfamily
MGVVEATSRLYRDMSVPVRAVIFDFFGVICSEVAPFVLPRYMPAEEAVAYKADAVERADLGELEFLDTLVDLSARVGAPVAELDAAFRACIKIDPAMVALAETLRGKVRVGLLSNAMRPFIYEILTGHNLERLFDARVISCEEHLTKPNPAIYRLMVERIGVPAAECLFTDDNRINVDAALAAGMQAVRFTDVTALKRELAARGFICPASARSRSAPHRGVGRALRVAPLRFFAPHRRCRWR